MKAIYHVIPDEYYLDKDLESFLFGDASMAQDLELKVSRAFLEHSSSPIEVSVKLNGDLREGSRIRILLKKPSRQGDANKESVLVDDVLSEADAEELAFLVQCSRETPELKHLDDLDQIRFLVFCFIIYCALRKEGDLSSHLFQPDRSDISLAGFLSFLVHAEGLPEMLVRVLTKTTGFLDLKFFPPQMITPNLHEESRTSSSIPEKFTVRSNSDHIRQCADKIARNIQMSDRGVILNGEFINLTENQRALVEYCIEQFRLGYTSITKHKAIELTHTGKLSEKRFISTVQRVYFDGQKERYEKIFFQPASGRISLRLRD